MKPTDFKIIDSVFTHSQAISKLTCESKLENKLYVFNVCEYVNIYTRQKYAAAILKKSPAHLNQILSKSEHYVVVCDSEKAELYRRVASKLNK